MDAKKISDALGGLNLVKPPVPGGSLAGVRHNAKEMEMAVRTSVRSAERGDKAETKAALVPNSAATTTVTPRGVNAEDGNAKKPTVTVPTSSSRSATPRNAAVNGTGSATAVPGGSGAVHGYAAMNGNSGEGSGGGSNKTLAQHNITRNSPRTGIDGGKCFGFCSARTLSGLPECQRGLRA
jgi:hypothetical protein